MSISDDELERRIENILPRALRNLGYIATPEQLATKNDIETLKIQMDERFLKVFERMERHDEEIKGIREEMKQQNEEIKSIREEMKQQNEVIKGIQEEIKEIKVEIKKQNERIEILFQTMNRGFTYIHDDLAKISSKYGKLREEEAQKMIGEVLKYFEIPSFKIHKLQIIDQDGIVFAKGYITDVDLYLEKDDEVWAFEFKANCDRFDLFGFHKVCELLEKGYGKKVVRKILACFDASDEIREDAKTFDIEIWQPETNTPGLMLPKDL